MHPVWRLCLKKADLVIPLYVLIKHKTWEEEIFGSIIALITYNHTTEILHYNYAAKEC